MFCLQDVITFSSFIHNKCAKPGLSSLCPRYITHHTSEWEQPHCHHPPNCRPSAKPPARCQRPVQQLSIPVCWPCKLFSTSNSFLRKTWMSKFSPELILPWDVQRCSNEEMTQLAIRKKTNRDYNKFPRWISNNPISFIFSQHNPMYLILGVRGSFENTHQNYGKMCGEQRHFSDSLVIKSRGI